MVTTDYMGATPETAWIVHNKNVKSIVDSILDVASDDHKQIQKRANFLDEVQNFSWEYVSEKMLKIFEKKG